MIERAVDRLEKRLAVLFTFLVGNTGADLIDLAVHPLIVFRHGLAICSIRHLRLDFVKSEHQGTPASQCPCAPKIILLVILGPWVSGDWVTQESQNFKLNPADADLILSKDLHSNPRNTMVSLINKVFLIPINMLSRL